MKTAGVPVKWPSPCTEQKISLIFNFVGCLIVLTLYHIHAPGCGDLLTYPSGNVLGCGIEGENLVEIGVVESVGNLLLDVGEVGHHAVFVELAGAAVDGDQPIVAVDLLTLALVRELELVAGGYFEGFLDVVHDGVCRY